MSRLSQMNRVNDQMTTVRGDVAPGAVQSGPPLTLLREAKLTSLLAPIAPNIDRYEASGVVVQGGLLWVIFDNLPHIAALHPALFPAPPGASLLRQQGRAAGYEDIAYDEVTGRRFILIEAAQTTRGGFQPQIDEFDASWHPGDRRWVELDIEDPNKGLEGLTCIRRNGRMYLLALSEGNGNHGGRRGRRPGHGLVHVLEQHGEVWTVSARINLPRDLQFADYSAISVRGDRIAVVSQESSALWVGALDPQTWRLAGAGTVHPFPREASGRVRYGTVEGISWIDDSTVAAVSDHARRRRSRRVRAAAESVHVFAFPRAQVSPGILPDRSAGTVDG